MKKINCYLLVVFFTLLSCDNSEMDFFDSSDLRVNQVLKMEKDAQKLAYSILEPKQKMKVWKIHFEEMKLSREFTNAQIDFINEIDGMLKPEYFEKGNMEFKVFSKYIHAKGIKIFSSEQLFYLVASLDSAMKDDGGGVPPLMGNCTCNTVDDWCVWGSKCTGTAFCEYKPSGCGTFLLEPCNGVCQRN